MAASEHLNQLQFVHHLARPGDLDTRNTRNHVVEAWPKNSTLAHIHPADRKYGGMAPEGEVANPIGNLDWHHKSGTIQQVHVEPGYRRKGIATEMFHQARTIAKTTKGVKPPKHSPDRTDAGNAWARSVGGRVPRRYGNDML